MSLGDINNGKVLMKFKGRIRRLQSCIYLTIGEGSTFILTSVTLLLIVTLYQIQNGQPRLIPYVNKEIPNGAQNCSISELKLCGLVINTANYSSVKESEFLY